MMLRVVKGSMSCDSVLEVLGDTAGEFIASYKCMENDQSHRMFNGKDVHRVVFIAGAGGPSAIMWQE